MTRHLIIINKKKTNERLFKVCQKVPTLKVEVGHNYTNLGTT